MLNTIGRIRKCYKIATHLCLLGMLNTIGRIQTPDLQDHRVTKMDQYLTNETDLNDYGFNSQDPVPTSHNVNKITGSGDKNKTDETIDHTGTRTLTRSGNIGVTTSQQMLESEVKLRALYNMIDILFNDIDFAPSSCSLYIAPNTTL